MAVAVIMPRQGNTVESCVINEWHKQVGDTVAVGDILFSYETDKAAFDEEAKVAGTVLKILYAEGDDVPCLENVCVIGQPGEDPDACLAADGAEAGAAPVAASAPAAVQQAAGDCTPVIMPRQGNTVESCVINEWHKQVGDSVSVGDVLFSYETDKAAFDEEAKVEGVLLAIFYEEGDDVPCLDNVCVIGKPGANAEAYRPGAEPPVPAEEAPAAAPAAEIAEPAVAVGDLKISPRAKKLAEQKGADLSSLTAGTGPDGRVIERDVQALIDAGKLIGATAAAEEKTAAPVAAAAAELGVPVDDSYTEPMSKMRKVIAKNMMTSLSTMAQLTHNISYDATEVKNARAMFKSKGEKFGMEKISINDIILYAVARTLAMPEHRALNANLIDDGNTMKYFNGVHLGFAVDTDRGLMVPTIFNADKMTLKQLSDTAKKLAKDCKEGKISPDYLKGGSFTVSNIGVYGIESFTPVINPPQTGILGVCAMKDAFRMENGEIRVYPSMNLSLSYDHRALDGTPASKFLVDLKANLENFTLLLARG